MNIINAPEGYEAFAIAMDKEKEKGEPDRDEHEQAMVHYIVWCSEHGRVSVWASQRVAEPQRNWHELQHLEGVMGKHTVVQVHVIVE